MYASVGEQWQVQHVKPNDRLVALVAMVVPMPCGRYDHVATSQWHLLALNCSEALAIDDEAAREGNMPMRRCSLAGLYYLQATIDSIGSVWRS